MHANLCMHILASIFQDGGNPFPVTRLPVLSNVTDLSRHTLLLPTLHSYGSHQVYIRHRRITGFHVVQEATCTHEQEYRLLGTSCYICYGHVRYILYTKVSLASLWYKRPQVCMRMSIGSCYYLNVIMYL